MLKIDLKSKESLSIDSFLIDDDDDEGEDIFNQIDEEKDRQIKENLSKVISSNLREKLFVQFNPKVVYQKCFEENKLGEKSHLTYKFLKNETKLIKKILEGHGFEQVHSSSPLFNLMWTSSSIKLSTFQSLHPFQRVNHFPKSSELTRKDRLYRNLQKMQQDKGFKHFDFVPTTFILPKQYEQFQTTLEKEKGIWIVKPIASSQGRGIFLINNIINVPKDADVVVSRYISNPLLIDGYKFDIRMYVAVTSYDPLVIYLYQEGLTRFATVKYDRNIENLSNNFIHLTNYSVNKEHGQYVRCNDPDIEDYGNKWTMSAMLRLLKSEGKNTFHLMMSIEDLIIKTFLSVQYSISNACQIFLPNKSNCFEVYGFDILIDDQLKAWLIEVNLSPSLNCDAPIDLKVKSAMICDLFNLISLPILDIYKYVNEEKYLVNKQCEGVLGNIPSGVKLSDNEKELNNLTNDQIFIVKKLEEENVRCGSFIRIFPCEETLEYFSHYFHEEKFHLNQIIHQYFYPNRWRKSSQNSFKKQIRRNHLQRSKYLSSLFYLLSKNSFYQNNSSELNHAIQRYQSYHKTYLNNHHHLIHSQKIHLDRSLMEFIEKENSFMSSSSDQILLRSEKTILSTNRYQYSNEKSFSRVSSVPKEQYQKRSSTKCRLDQSSRLMSTSIQEKKRMSRFLSSSLSTPKLSNDDENNQSHNEEFVDQLNEISSKQHRRQYSGIKYFNNLPNEEEETNDQEKNILQKTDQILQENQLKNDELAKQAKIFKEKIRRNEIYSALHRYSHRPASSNKSQQLRTNGKISIFLAEHRRKPSN